MTNQNEFLTETEIRDQLRSAPDLTSARGYVIDEGRAVEAYLANPERFHIGRGTIAEATLWLS